MMDGSPKSKKDVLKIMDLLFGHVSTGGYGGLKIQIGWFMRSGHEDSLHVEENE